VTVYTDTDMLLVIPSEKRVDVSRCHWASADSCHYKSLPSDAYRLLPVPSGCLHTHSIALCCTFCLI